MAVILHPECRERDPRPVLSLLMMPLLRLLVWRGSGAVRATDHSKSDFHFIRMCVVSFHME